MRIRWVVEGVSDTSGPASLIGTHLEPLTSVATDVLRARIADRVRIRPEPSFGGALAYTPNRDHFFALDAEHSKLLWSLGKTYTAVRPADRERVITLARLGICQTIPETAERAHYGQSLIGTFNSLPTCERPFVVNCFTTAHCALQCLYCHADDLMVDDRDGESGDWLAQVVRTAEAVPAMVGVVTGGEPLIRPERAEHLIKSLAVDKAVVLDTSGVGDLDRLMPLLHEHQVHTRVSIDSAAARVNDSLRPINRRELPVGESAYKHAIGAIERLTGEGMPCSAQTVVTTRNDRLESLLRLRDLLVEKHVNTWVLHMVVPVAKARQNEKLSLLPPPEVRNTLIALVRQSADAGIPIDIRVTNTASAPNSTVLVSAKGEFCVEDPDGTGKKRFGMSPNVTRRHVMDLFDKYIDRAGHASRYLNGPLDRYPQPMGAELRVAGRRP